MLYEVITDLHIDLVRLWQDRHGRGACMDAPAALGLGEHAGAKPVPEPLQRPGNALDIGEIRSNPSYNFV